MPRVFTLLNLTYGCTKNNSDFGPQISETSPISIPPTNKVIIGNEGTFNFGNASISLIDEITQNVSLDVFRNKNGYPLGDIAQSMMFYDSLGYIVVNNSGKIEVVNRLDFSSVATITGINSPRVMAVVSEDPLRAWVTDLYAEKIYELDLESRKIVREIAAPGWNDYIYVSQNKAWVMDVRDSVIVGYDVVSGNVEHRIELASAIIDFKPWSQWSLMVLATDGLYNLDILSGTYVQVEMFKHRRSASRMAVDSTRSLVYFIDRDVYRYDQNGVSSVVESPMNASFYGLDVKPSTGELYLTDAKDYVRPGQVIRYSLDFTDSTLFSVGVIPQFIRFE